MKSLYINVCCKIDKKVTYCQLVTHPELFHGRSQEQYDILIVTIL